MSEPRVQESSSSSVSAPPVSSDSAAAATASGSTVGVADARPSNESGNTTGTARPVSKDSSNAALTVSKIQIHLRAVAGAPALVTSKFNIDGSKNVLDVELFLRKKLGHAGALFLYCGGGFSPTPDQTLADLFEEIWG